MSCSGIIKKNWGFMANFGLGMAGALIAMFYTILFVKDSRNMRPKEVIAMDAKIKAYELSLAKDKWEKGGKKGQAPSVEEQEKEVDNGGKVSEFCPCTSMFDWQHPKKAFNTTFRKRLYGVRPYLLLLMTIFVLEIFVQNGKGPTMFLFLRKEFSWNESTFGLYVACFGVLGLFTQYVAVPFMTENLGMRDSTLGFLAVLGATIQQVMVAFAKEDWVLYVAGLIAFLAPCITTTCR